ncbi:MAG: FHA domain-containing protein [Myxococcota bacterium]|jgi:pSer/pThr/pTyr-binding forkhead associated (FHA) protein|nr:FHA domain-containing protein [Myxococcota bacterium]
MAFPGKSAALVIRTGGFEGTRFELSGEETLIGRNPTTDITLLDEGISREHAIILFDAETERYEIEDLESTNGVKVNGRRVRSAVLASGDAIQIGHTLFEFVCGAQADGGGTQRW